jgi:hypothetical protein
VDELEAVLDPMVDLREQKAAFVEKTFPFRSGSIALEREAERVRQGLEEMDVVFAVLAVRGVVDLKNTEGRTGIAADHDVDLTSDAVVPEKFGHAEPMVGGEVVAERRDTHREGVAGRGGGARRQPDVVDHPVRPAHAGPDDQRVGGRLVLEDLGTGRSQTLGRDARRFPHDFDRRERSQCETAERGGQDLLPHPSLEAVRGALGS